MDKKQRRLLIITFLVLAVIASGITGFLLFGNTVEVAVATQTVTGNTKITSSMFTVQRRTRTDLPDSYISGSKAGKLAGYYTSIGFTKGSVITANNVATTSNRASSAIESGKTLLAITSDNLPSELQKGDAVNIIISATASGSKIALTYQDITVSNIYYDDDNAITGVEVSVTPEQAQKIVYAQQNGTLSVALLPPDYTSKDLGITDESGFLDTSVTSTNTTDTTSTN